MLCMISVLLNLVRLTFVRFILNLVRFMAYFGEWYMCTLFAWRGLWISMSFLYPCWFSLCSVIQVEVFNYNCIIEHLCISYISFTSCETCLCITCVVLPTSDCSFFLVSWHFYQYVMSIFTLGHFLSSNIYFLIQYTSSSIWAVFVYCISFHYFYY